MKVIPIVFIIVLNITVFTLMAVMIFKSYTKPGLFQERAHENCREFGTSCQVNAGQVPGSI